MTNDLLFRLITQYVVRMQELIPELSNFYYTNLTGESSNTLYVNETVHSFVTISPNPDQAMGYCAKSKLKTGTVYFRVTDRRGRGTQGIVTQCDAIISAFDGKHTRGITFTSELGMSSIEVNKQEAFAVLAINYRLIT